MAHGVVHQFPGGTEEQYRASVAAVHPSDGSLPEGQGIHIATGDGWLIVAVHESRRAGSGSATERSCHACKRAATGGLEGPPDETAFEVRQQASG